MKKATILLAGFVLIPHCYAGNEDLATKITNELQKHGQTSTSIQAPPASLYGGKDISRPNMVSLELSQQQTAPTKTTSVTI
jgi:hypothetical protein